MNGTAKQSAKVIEALLVSGAWKATLFLSPTEVVRATRRLYRSRKSWGSMERLEFSVTYGKPNYQERKMVKDFKKAGEPLPVRKVQLKYHRARPHA